MMTRLAVIHHQDLLTEALASRSPASSPIRPSHGVAFRTGSTVTAAACGGEPVAHGGASRGTHAAPGGLAQVRHRFAAFLHGVADTIDPHSSPTH